MAIKLVDELQRYASRSTEFGKNKKMKEQANRTSYKIRLFRLKNSFYKIMLMQNYYFLANSKIIMVQQIETSKPKGQRL